MKYFLFNYDRYNIPQHVFEAEYIEEASLKVLEYVAAKDVQTVADMPALPLVLSVEVRNILPKEIAQLYFRSGKKGHYYYRLLSLNDDIYKVGPKDEYETRTDRVVY